MRWCNNYDAISILSKNWWSWKIQKKLNRDVVRTNLFSSDDGRWEQIGADWVKLFLACLFIWCLKVKFYLNTCMKEKDANILIYWGVKKSIDWMLFQNLKLIQSLHKPCLTFLRSWSKVNKNWFHFRSATRKSSKASWTDTCLKWAWTAFSIFSHESKMSL